MTALGRAGPGQNQEPRTPSGSLMWVAELKHLAITCCLPACISRKPDQKQNNEDWKIILQYGIWASQETA